MFVIFKNEIGGFSVRPAYIGFIKNDFLRRLLCSIFYPFTIIVTIVINLLGVFFVSFTMLIKAIWLPLKGLKKPIWKTEIWLRPRNKNDSCSRMD